MSQYSQADKKNHLELKQVLGKAYDYIPPDSIVLDVGCSAGYFGKSLIQDKNAIVDGVEVDFEDAKIAEKLLNSVYSFDIEKELHPDKLIDKKYDIIFFGDVLEHLRNPGSVLQRFSKLLKNSGRIIISVPNIAHVSIRLELLSGSFEYEKLGILDETHLKYFTFTSFSRLLKETGFKIIDYDYALSVLPEKVINDWLKKLGLKAYKKFYHLMNSPEATAYQYKFVVELGEMKKLPQVPTKPLELATQLAVLHSYQINELDKLVNSLKEEIGNRDKEINDIKNSTSWRVTKPLRSAKKIISRKK